MPKAAVNWNRIDQRIKQMTIEQPSAMERYSTYMNTPPPTYPARPTKGGRFDLAPPKRGRWFYEPKYNGWRVLVHTPTGRCFNRHLEPLSIEDEFDEALGAIVSNAPPWEWLDCEGLDRRHGIGRGTLIVLDVVVSHGTYEQRREWLEPYYNSALIDPGRIGANQVLLTKNYLVGDLMWSVLQSGNSIADAPFYEGLVAKQADSLYPIQLDSPSREFRGWVKHRFDQ